MERCENSWRLLAVNVFCKTLHLRCLTEFWISLHFWYKVFQGFLSLSLINSLFITISTKDLVAWAVVIFTILFVVILKTIWFHNAPQKHPYHLWYFDILIFSTIKERRVERSLTQLFLKTLFDNVLAIPPTTFSLVFFFFNFFEGTRF